MNDVGQAQHGHATTPPAAARSFVIPLSDEGALNITFIAAIHYLFSAARCESFRIHNKCVNIETKGKQVGWGNQKFIHKMLLRRWEEKMWKREIVLQRAALSIRRFLARDTAERWRT